ncbi:MAG TPA: HDIG domain-containing protein [Ignavibacteriaceae bacterium]|nr:HDIG domain-containing protein [Ignavibacteriaceae bacterium]HOJ17328.1 HDIG domain-containing protein [Ignavibacteriaceae bacterium]
MMRDREFCMGLLREYTKSESLIKHALAVESCVVEYARKFGEDADYWGNVALLHDFDYERYPGANQHPFEGGKILKERGFDEEFVSSVLSHADYTGVPRDTKLKKVLFACDELAGFITAVAYVRPSKSVDEVEVRSVIKKIKDRAFAKNVSREDIRKGAEGLGIDLEEHIGFCIEAMKKRRHELGL